jgi:hypothetical protein
MSNSANYSPVQSESIVKLDKLHRPGPESLSARLYAASAMSSAACLLVNCNGI